MSVLIKGMKKPEKCEDCRCICSCGEGWRCGLVITNGRRHGYSFEELHNACPLVSVPTPHGRLIDADDIKTITVACTECGCIKHIDAPIVIESEE